MSFAQKNQFINTLLDKVRSVAGDYDSRVLLLVNCVRFLVDNLHTVSHTMDFKERRNLIASVRKCLETNIPELHMPTYELLHEELQSYARLLEPDLRPTPTCGYLLVCDPDLRHHLALD
jgi:hypothetical protein